MSNFLFVLRSILVFRLVSLISLDRLSFLRVDCWYRCWIGWWKIEFNTWFDSDQMIFRIRSAQVDVSGVNEISPLLSFFLGPVP